MQVDYKNVEIVSDKIFKMCRQLGEVIERSKEVLEKFGEIPHPVNVRDRNRPKVYM